MGREPGSKVGDLLRRKARSRQGFRVPSRDAKFARIANDSLILNRVNPWTRFGSLQGPARAMPVDARATHDHRNNSGPRA